MCVLSCVSLPRRIKFMGMMTELVSPKSHHTDDVNLQNANVIRDFAGQFRLGYWISIGPSAKKDYGIEMRCRFWRLAQNLSIQYSWEVPSSSKGTVKRRDNIHFTVMRAVYRHDLPTDRISKNPAHARHDSRVHGRPARAAEQRRRTIKFFERYGRINISQRLSTPHQERLEKIAERNYMPQENGNHIRHILETPRLPEETSCLCQETSPTGSKPLDVLAPCCRPDLSGLCHNGSCPRPSSRSASKAGSFTLPAS